MAEWLYAFTETMLDAGTGTKTWNERGDGVMRFLRHRENQISRLVMRHARTMTVICNHRIDCGLSLRRYPHSDRHIMWVASDFSTGELQETTFCVKFADPEKALQFEEKFIECQREAEAPVDDLTF
jgi:Ran-binding protein 1